MTHTPCPADHHAALALRLSEAALEGAGWPAVARALEAEAGPGVRLERQAGDPDGGTAASGLPGSIVLAVLDLGIWRLNLTAGSGGAPALSAPVREALGLATRLKEGRTLALFELEAVLDPLPYAVVLLDADACLLFANMAGDDLLTSRRLFRPVRPGARLRPALKRADEALEAAVTHILHEGGGDARWVVRVPDGGHLAIHLRPLGPERLERGAARILMTLRSIAAARDATLAAT